MLKIFGKAKKNVRIGYTTHNGFSAVIAYAANRELAKKACEYGMGSTDAQTHKKQAMRAIEFLKAREVEK